MKPVTIHKQATQTGHIAITSDDVGVFLELRDADNGMELLVNMDDLIALARATWIHEDAIKQAEKGKLEAAS